MANNKKNVTTSVGVSGESGCVLDYEPFNATLLLKVILDRLEVYDC
jgi:hypothetical protein